MSWSCVVTATHKSCNLTATDVEVHCLARNFSHDSKSSLPNFSSTSSLISVMILFMAACVSFIESRLAETSWKSASFAILSLNSASKLTWFFSSMSRNSCARFIISVDISLDFFSLMKVDATSMHRPHQVLKRTMTRPISNIQIACKRLRTQAEA